MIVNVRAIQQTKLQAHKERTHATTFSGNPTMIKDTRLLIEFAAVAQAGSFTLAARELGVAQPWLSAQVRKLEEQLGVRLLDRSGRGLSLTPWGAELLEIAAPLRHQTATVLAQVATLANRAKDTLHIGLPPSGVDAVILKIMQDAKLGAHNDISVEHSVSESLIGRLQQGILDLAFFIGTFDLDPAIVDQLSICPVYVELILDQHDPLAAVPGVRLAQLEGRTLSVFPRRLNPGLYDDVVTQALAAEVAIGHFPELNLQARTLNEEIDTPVRIALATALGGSVAPSGHTCVRVLDVDGCWLQVARLKSNSLGVVRRSFWQAARSFATRFSAQ
jgi:DNA-binding transcriptional LysR family regulator